MIDLFGITFAESIYKRNGLTERSKHRMSKEIAQELKEKMGNGAYLYCLERLSNNTQNPQLWRDVLDWLDETETETNKGETNERL
jgi:hypothetical protein